MNEHTLSSLRLERRLHPEGHSKLSSVIVAGERSCDEVSLTHLEGDGLLYCVRENINLVSLIIFVERETRHKQARCVFSRLYHRSATTVIINIVLIS